MISIYLSVSGCMLILCSASCCITEIKHYLRTVRNGMHAYVNECLILLFSQYYTFLFFPAPTFALWFMPFISSKSTPAHNGRFLVARSDLGPRDFAASSASSLQCVKQDDLEAPPDPGGSRRIRRKDRICKKQSLVAPRTLNGSQQVVGRDRPARRWLYCGLGKPLREDLGYPAKTDALAAPPLTAARTEGRKEQGAHYSIFIDYCQGRKRS